MNRKQAIERFLDDFLCFELPPLSEEVLTAVREIKQKGFEVENESHYINKRNEAEAISKKYVFAAILALLVVSVPIIVVMTNQKPVSELTNSPVLPDSSEAVSALVSASESQAISETEAETTLEHIKLKQINGKVALSGKSEEELEMLLVTYSENNNVYEDDRNIYNFDSQGRLIEMRKADLGDEEGQSVDEQAIAARVNALLKEYYPDWSENECDIRIGKNEDSRPAWTAEVIKTKSDLTEVIYITFERTGELSRIVKLDSNENVGIISKDEASGKTEEKSHPAEKTDSSENKSSEPASQTAKKTDSSANEPSANPSQSGEQSRPAEKTDSSENKSSEPASQTDKKADGHANEQSDPHSRSKEPVTAVATKVSSEVAKKLGNSRSYIEDVINEDFGGLTQEQFDRIAIYKSAHEGRHPYSEAVEAGIVDPDAPKMTLEKMKEIISKANESVTGGRRFNYILYEAKKIQLYYDITADSITEYYYVLSADGDGKEKEAIKITVDYPYGVIQYIRTDEKGEDGKNKKEILFDSEKDDVEEVPLWKQTANEEREKRENGDPLYANALKAGTVDPKAPKLSYDDVKSIIAAVKDEIPDDGGCTPVYQGKAIVERIRNIQRCPDLYYGCYNSHTRYVYWPDADTVEERRTCIDVCDYESLTGCRIVYYVYNDNGDIVTEEVLYNTML